MRVLPTMLFLLALALAPAAAEAQQPCGTITTPVCPENPDPDAEPRAQANAIDADLHVQLREIKREFKRFRNTTYNDGERRFVDQRYIYKSAENIYRGAVEDARALVTRTEAGTAAVGKLTTYYRLRARQYFTATSKLISFKRRGPTSIKALRGRTGKLERRARAARNAANTLLGLTIR